VHTLLVLNYNSNTNNNTNNNNNSNNSNNSNNNEASDPQAALLQIKRAMGRTLRSLRTLPRPTLAASAPDPAALRCRAARIIQRVVRRLLARRHLEKQVRAVGVISRAYGCFRWRRSLTSAAEAARRARRRAPVEAALRVRAARKEEADAEAAARHIQAEWRALIMRRWCRRIDRAARRLQGWTRRRWMRRKLGAEAERLMVRRGRKVDKPPPPPSKWLHKAAPEDTQAASRPSGEERPDESQDEFPGRLLHLPVPPQPRPLSSPSISGVYNKASAAPQRLPSPASAKAAGRLLPFFPEGMPSSTREDRIAALAAAAALPQSKKKALHRTLAALPPRPSPIRVVATGV